MNAKLILHPLPVIIGEDTARRVALSIRSPLVLMAVALLPGVVTSLPAQLVQVSYSSWVEIAKAVGTDPLHSHMNNPRALAFDTDDGAGHTVRKVVANWQANKDYAPWPYYHGYRSSTNGGASYGAITITPNVDLMTAIKRRDGTLVAVPFFPHYPTLPAASFPFTYHTSADNGGSWTEHPWNAADGGTVSFGANQCLGMRFHRGIIEENDGSLYAPVYVRFTTDGDFRSVLVKSTDGGRTWNYHATIQPATTVNYTETAIVRCADGSWLAVHRSDANGVPQDLKQQRSTDGGLTWSTVVYLPGLADSNGVDPNLLLMPNGILVLTYGYNSGTAAGRHVKMAFSQDGNGVAWSNNTTTFTGVSNVLESTGYTAAWPVSAHRFAKIADTGVSWSYSSEFPGGTNPYSIRQTFVDLVRTQRNRIDLKTKSDAGAITVTTDLSYANAAHPETKTTGAFDGSTDYWSGAFKSGNPASATYTIDLQQTHTLNAVGICLHQHNPESATVQVSADGSVWTTVKTYANATHHAIDYTNFTPVSARYARVNLSGPSASFLCLNEIELYSAADTFENYALGVAPYGYTSPASGFWVTAGATPTPSGYQSERALYMTDTQTAAWPTISKTTTATAAKSLEFRYRSKAFAPSGAHQFHLRSGTTTVYRLAVFSDGSIRYYNGAWVVLSGAGTVPADTWVVFKIDATISPANASVRLNGVLKGTVYKENSGPTTMNNFLFGTTGTAPAGDQALFDDVTFN